MKKTIMQARMDKKLTQSQLAQVLNIATKINKGTVAGVSVVASLSLALSYPTVAAAPHMSVNAYKNALVIAVETDYSFPLADKVNEYLADPCHCCFHYKQKIIQKQISDRYCFYHHSNFSRQSKLQKKMLHYYNWCTIGSHYFRISYRFASLNPLYTIELVRR